METFIKRVYLSLLFLSGILVSGCGGGSESENSLEITEGPPQVTITLHSQLDLDYSLDPDPQVQVSKADKDEFAGVDNEFIAGVYAKLKKTAMLRSQKGRQPAFKTDTEYQSIDRYEKIDKERYAITIKKSPEKSQIRDTVKIQDKPLIFAGRGYNVSAFEKEHKPAIDVDYSTHLVATLSDPTGSHLREHLDPNSDYSKNTKFLVYNSTRSAFGKLPAPLVESKPEPLHKAESVAPLVRNPDSVLLFPKGGKSLLVLRKAEKEFDLLTGNEALNRKEFKADPETSKKTPKTLQ